jgi:mannose-6-phosphate isomerase
VHQGRVRSIAGAVAGAARCGRSPTENRTTTDKKEPMSIAAPDRSVDVFVTRRPWGQFEQFVSNEVCTVKIITVHPGHRLSLQTHSRRDEMWQVMDAPIEVEVDDRRWTAAVGERVWVPRRSRHRMGNSGTRPGRVLEVAFGDFDESDIERLQDDYARSKDS